MKRFSAFLLLIAVGILARGCVGSSYSYSPSERMIVARSHNDFLPIGPCGAPWNYDDQVAILLPTNSDRCDFSQLEVYQNGKLRIDSGHVFLDRTNKVVKIDLTLDGVPNGIKCGPIECKYNGWHRYVEREQQSGECTRQWLVDFYRSNGIGTYVPY